MIQTDDIYTASGDGSTLVFNIPHGLPKEPYWWTAKEASDDACYDGHIPGALAFNVTANSTHLVVTYVGWAPPNGVNNLSWTFSAKCK